MTKTLKIEVNIKIARRMLNVAGYKGEELKHKSDDEIFTMAIDMCKEYGVNIIEILNEN